MKHFMQIILILTVCCYLSAFYVENAWTSNKFWLAQSHCKQAEIIFKCVSDCSKLTGTVLHSSICDLVLSFIHQNKIMGVSLNTQDCSEATVKWRTLNVSFFFFLIKRKIFLFFSITRKLQQIKRGRTKFIRLLTEMHKMERKVCLCNNTFHLPENCRIELHC